jgi:predicted RNase H-like nuclease (RuvC/YqgF family)
MPPLFAFTLTDAAQLSSPVGIIVAAYLLWERFSQHRTERRKAELANAEQKIKLDVMANDAIQAACNHLLRVRKEAHDADIASLTRRLTDLEARDVTCQDRVKSLQKQNTEQAAEIIELRGKIEGLEAKLRAAGALPGSGSHTTLRTDPD